MLVWATVRLAFVPRCLFCETARLNSSVLQAYRNVFGDGPTHDSIDALNAETQLLTLINAAFCPLEKGETRHALVHSQLKKFGLNSDDVPPPADFIIKQVLSEIDVTPKPKVIVRL